MHKNDDWPPRLKRVGPMPKPRLASPRRQPICPYSFWKEAAIITIIIAFIIGFAISGVLRIRL